MKPSITLSSPSTLCISCIAVICLMISCPLSAQEPEYGESTGYIDAKYGIKEFLIPYEYEDSNDSPRSAKRRSLYALDPSGQPATLLWFDFDNNNLLGSKRQYRVLYGTTRIAKGAFNKIEYTITIYIPSTLRYFPEDILNSKISFIVDDSKTKVTSISDVKEDNPQVAKEVARYNVQGIKTNKQEKGPQIIQYDDGSAKKVINR